MARRGPGLVGEVSVVLEVRRGVHDEDHVEEAHELRQHQLRHAARLDQGQAGDQHELAQQIDRFKPGTHTKHTACLNSVRALRTGDCTPSVVGGSTAAAHWTQLTGQ